MIDELSIIDHLKAYSVYTWERIAFTWQNRRGKLFETTITQDLIFWIYQSARFTNLPFELWESVDETTNGNDIELVVETLNGYLLFPCQAKKVNALHKYPTLNHKVDDIQQIHSLLKYASNNSGMGIYLLYNCCGDSNYIHTQWRGNYENLSPYGCSVVPADFLNEVYLKVINPKKYKWRIPSFQELHPKAGVPLHEFINELITGSVFSNKLWEYYKNETPQSYFLYDDLFDPEKWDNLTPPPRISGIPKEKNVLQAGVKPSINFNPRFRIIISRKKRLATVRRFS